MSFFDKLKVKKGKPEAKSEKEENVLDLVKEDAAVKDKKPEKLKESTGDAYRILVRPQLSEKANMLSKSGKYVFRVYPGANKPEVKKAIEKVYEVHVKQVNIINFQGKARRYGRAAGRTKSWKKAIVTLVPGEHIQGVTETV